MPSSVGQKNRILRALPTSDYRRITTEMQRVTPPLGEVIARPGHPPGWAYFPLGGVISAVVVLEDGSTVEGFNIGNEGMFALSLLAGTVAVQARYVVQVPGEMLRLRADRFRKMVAGSGALSDLLLRYALVLIDRAAQNVACNQHHTIEERMCRWLLETSHRTGRDSFILTQEFLGDLLGVRRQSVNLIARVLQRAKLIDYRRGRLKILDRAGLEEASCECFRVSQAAYEKLMQMRPAGGGTR